MSVLTRVAMTCLHNDAQRKMFFPDFMATHLFPPTHALIIKYQSATGQKPAATITKSLNIWSSITFITLPCLNFNLMALMCLLKEPTGQQRAKTSPFTATTNKTGRFPLVQCQDSHFHSNMCGPNPNPAGFYQF